MIRSRRRSREGEDAPRRASRLAVVRRRCYKFVASGERSFARSRSTLVILFRMRRIFSFDHPHERRNARALARSRARARSRPQPQPRPIDARSSACPVPAVTVYDTTFTPCRRMYRSRPRKSSKIPHLLRTHTLIRYNHTYTVPFSADKVHAPRGSFPLETRGMSSHSELFSLSLSLGRRSVDADARRPTIDRARA